MALIKATGVKLTPAFEAYLSANQTVSDSTSTKAQIDTEVLDTNGYYDNSTNYRFTPLIAGKYFVYGSVYARTATSSTLDWGITYIYKNGVVYRQQITQFTSNRGRQASVYVTAIIDMNGSTDYVELFGSTNVSSGTPEFSSSDKGTYFGAYRIGD